MDWVTIRKEGKQRLNAGGGGTVKNDTAADVQHGSDTLRKRINDVNVFLFQ